MSPWVDLTMSCGSWDENAEFDVVPIPGQEGERVVGEREADELIIVFSRSVCDRSLESGFVLPRTGGYQKVPYTPICFTLVWGFRWSASYARSSVSIVRIGRATLRDSQWLNMLLSVLR
jgi:hypothetical protein